MSLRAPDARDPRTSTTSSWPASARARSPGCSASTRRTRRASPPRSPRSRATPSATRGGGQVEFALEGRTPPQVLVDPRHATEGPGIADLRARSSTAATARRPAWASGIVGARRLMDRFDDRDRAGQRHDGHAQEAPARAGAARRRRRDLGRLGRELARQRAARARSTRCSSRTRSCCARWTSCAARQDELVRAQPRAGGHQPRRGGALRRARREGRSPAARRRDEVALPVEHEPRVPHAAELDPGAGRAAARAAATATSTAEQEKQVGFIRKAAEDLSELVNDLLDLAKVEAGKIVVRPSDVRGRRPVRRAARHAAAAAGQRRRCALVFEEPDGRARRSTPTRARSRRSCATSSPTRSSSPSAARSACRRRRRRRATTVVVRGRRHRHRHRRRGPGADLRGVRRRSRAPCRRGSRAPAWACRSAGSWPSCSAAASRVEQRAGRRLDLLADACPASTPPDDAAGAGRDADAGPAASRRCWSWRTSRRTSSSTRST